MNISSGFAIVGLACTAWWSHAAYAAGPRPNIVLVITDDMGFSDIGCYGGEINTPNIDTLARGGAKFSQFYNCGKCESSRAALTTGHQFWTVPTKDFYVTTALSDYAKKFISDEHAAHGIQLNNENKK